MAKRPDIIREDDRVRVLVPRFVTRVGYPKQPSDYLDAARAKYGGQLAALLKDFHTAKRDHIHARIEDDLAYLMAQADKFGGRERSLHWLELPDLKGVEMNVGRIITRTTGTYYSPSYSRSYDGDDYEPGGLADMKRHRLAGVSSLGCFSKLNVPGQLWAPVEHLEKIHPT
jgi:hypothetical protein